MPADPVGGELLKAPSTSARRRWPKLLDSSGAGKRARAVVNLILERGHCTTEDLAALGYEHPPRAARDVRELGIPLVTLKVRGQSGRLVAAYTLPPSLPSARPQPGSGRRAIPKRLKQALLVRDGARCAVCGLTYEAQHLQADHRVPYQVRPDSGRAAVAPDRLMLLCGSCQRSKSWSCEHCPNWVTRDAETCLRCYWGSPDNHFHIAIAPARRLDVVWTGDDCAVYDTALSACADGIEGLRLLLLALLRTHVGH